VDPRTAARTPRPHATDSPRSHTSQEHRPDFPRVERAHARLQGAARNLRERGTALGRRYWDASRVVVLRRLVAAGTGDPVVGYAALVIGTVLLTLLILLINRIWVPLPNPGMVYLMLVAMLAYHWSWRPGVLAGVFALVCVYVLFIPPIGWLKAIGPRSVEELVTLAAVTAFVLALAQLARGRREMSEREAGRFAALNHVGGALAGELDEPRLLDLIARTAQALTGAHFAAFTLRPVDDAGRPLVPSEGNLFHLAAVIGVTPEQEALFRRLPLGGEGILAPIFRFGRPVRVADALSLMESGPVHGGMTARATADEDKGGSESAVPVRPGSPERVEAARQVARDYARGQATADDLRAVGVPRGHPIVRSFLGAPLLDSAGQVRGGLLLGHDQPDQFTADDEALLIGLAAQASVALENARLFRAANSQARELDTIFESIADGICVVDGRGEVVRENAAAHQLREGLARTRGEEAVRELLLRAAAEAGAGSIDGIEVSSSDAAGERREYIVAASPLVANDPPHAAQRDGERPKDAKEQSPAGLRSSVVVWHDVTAARRLERERLARSEAEARRTLLQAVVDVLPSGVYLVRGHDARLVLANRAAMGAWGAPWPEGVSMAEFLQTSGTRMFSAEGRQLEASDLATLRALLSGEPIRQYQEVIRHPDGTTLPVLLNAVPFDSRALGIVQPEDIANQSGQESDTPAEPAALVVLQDVTALKEAERLKDDFIAIAAHELRNPMAVLQGYAQMLVRQTGAGASDDLRAEAVEAIDQATLRLVVLTDDLLDVTRLQGGRLTLHMEPADLAALARRVAKRIQITSEHHRIVVDADPEYVVAAIDLQRTEQVLTNLLNNAIKYSPDGGEVRVCVREAAAAGIAEVEVRDQGIGIPAEQQARIFGRFARADNAKDRGITGTGLGLFLSRELVERQGGRIWFESAEGHGTTFYVSLLLAQSEDGEGVPAGPGTGAPQLHSTAIE
jgi:two-component system, OmpR family, phosphate regulon sensor histidine kinase PhoR